MRITVINGSPKGKDSITLQTVLYLEKMFPECSFRMIHAGQKIRIYEKDFNACREELEKADLILFSYPVYTFLVPAQLHRFIELIRENHVDLQGKYATQITTSKHFYDVTARAFIRENCMDLGMRWLNGLSADMSDLLNKKGQKEAQDYFRFIIWQMERGIYESAPKPHETSPLRKTNTEVPLNAEKRPGMVMIVTDYDPGDPDSVPLVNMIRRFQNRISRETDVVNLREFSFAGGCLGCFNCAATGACIYRDGFDSLLRDRIQKADAIVYAYSIRDHSMGYRFKLYDDRQFCNGHRTVTMGDPQGYLVHGKLSAESNLKTVMEARAQVGGNYLCGIACDEEDPDTEIDRLAERLDYVIDVHYTQPKNFYGVGGLKIFRDLIWQMQGLMQEDHRFYKKHGFYDFPQKKKGTILGMYAVGTMMKNKKLNRKMRGKMTEGMILPYRNIIRKAGKK